jgi:hypothetical protein
MNQNSLEAYECCDRNPLRAQCYRNVCEANDGLTVDECRAMNGDSGTNSTYAARFSDLAKAGRIVARGRRRTRSGCMANVYYPAEQFAAAGAA